MIDSSQRGVRKRDEKGRFTYEKEEQKQEGLQIEPESTVKQRRKVAIVGFASESRGLAPYHDPGWEIWCINKLWSVNIPNFRWDRWYEIHKPENWDPSHLAWLKSQPPGKPIYMQRAFTDIPASVEFPIDDILRRFDNFHTNSVSLLMAHALLEGVDDLGLWGVDLESGGEYEIERPSALFFAGIARGMGVSLYLPKESPLLKAPFLYGYENPPGTFPAMKADYERYQQEGEILLRDINNQEYELEQTKIKFYMKKGHVDAARHFLKMNGVAVSE